MSTPPHDSNLVSPGISNKIDLLCDRFEEELRAGRKPRIEDFLAETQGREQTVLLRELLIVELDYRQRVGESVSIDEYAGRFPEHTDVLSQLQDSFAQLTPRRAESTGDDETIVFEHDGTVMGRFRLLNKLGSGGFGTVWRAYDPRLDRHVAIKLPKAQELSPGELRQFLREAQSAAQLKHPHIVAVHEVGDEAQPFIVSDYIEGRTLKDWMATRQPAPAQVAEITAHLADALEHAHQFGIVHRDVKPSNVLLDTAGVPHLADFGLAKRLADDRTITLEGAILGTPAYMSPEQAGGHSRAISAKTDIYSLGVLLYEMLTGHRPFEGEVESVIVQVLNDEPQPLRKFKPELPRDIETICLKAMAKRPADRYATAGEMAADLRRFLAGEPIHARPVSCWERWYRRARRKPLETAAVAVAGLALAALAVFALWMRPALSGPFLRTVVLETDPPGAQLAFVPLDEVTNQPLPEQIIHADHRSPIEMDLPPGGYLVIAHFDDERFHEVYRHVPEEHPGMYGPFNHFHWTFLDDDRIQLRQIRIPPAAITTGMAYLEGDPQFAMGLESEFTDSNIGIPRHTRSVPAFYIDPTEVSVQQMTQPRWYEADDMRNSIPVQMKRLIPNPPPEHPVTHIAWDHAMHIAETLGKRLPEEAEYEFAATAGGKHAYPWGNDPGRLVEYQPAVEPVGATQWDRLETNPPVLGLCTNISEWTVSPFSEYPGFLEFHREKFGVELRHRPDEHQMRIHRGFNFQRFEEDAKPETQSDEWRDLPRQRLAVIRQIWKRGLGLRCVRSAKPRLRPEDFVCVVEP